MTDVFVSDKREERDQVSLIAAKLQELGLSVWFDARLQTGGGFHGEINREVRSGKAVLVCWTPAAIESHWVLSEAQIGLDRGVLAPTFLGACDLPPPFNGVHTESLVAWAGAHDAPGWLALLDRLGQLIGRPGLRHIALALAAGEPVRVHGRNEAVERQPARSEAPPLRAADPPAPGGSEMSHGERAGSGVRLFFARIGQFLNYLLKLAFAAALGPIAYFMMKRWIVFWFTLVVAVFVAWGAWNSSQPWQDTLGGRAVSAFEGWLVGHLAGLALFFLINLVPRTSREGFMRGLGLARKV